MDVHRVHFVFANGCECIAAVQLLPPHSKRTETQCSIPYAAMFGAKWIYDLDEKKVIKRMGRTYVPLDIPEIHCLNLSRTFLKSPSAKSLAVCLNIDKEISTPLT